LLIRGFAAAVLVSAVAESAGEEVLSTVTFTGGRDMICHPAGAAVVWTSGAVPSVADTSAPAGSRARYGDTKTQAISVSRTSRRGSGTRTGHEDVVASRLPRGRQEKGGAIDTQGWNAAYGQFFNNATNPVKPARRPLALPRW
jgi:hypothetical protein